MSSMNISKHCYSTLLVLSILLDALHTLTRLILITSHSQMEKIKLREGKCLAQGHTASTRSTTLPLFTTVLSFTALSVSERMLFPTILPLLLELKTTSQDISGKRQGMLKSVDSGRNFLSLALGSNSYHVLNPPLPEFLSSDCLLTLKQ